MDDCSKDVINGLPDNLLIQILSSLSTKEAALTSLLSERWRYLFAFVPNLDFDDFSSLETEIAMKDQTRFISFVNRVLELRGNDHVNKFSLKCGDGVERVNVLPWISYALRRGVSDLALHLSPDSDYSLPSKFFKIKTLVRLRIETQGGIVIKPGNAYLPKLKTLYLDSVAFGTNENEVEFAELVRGCPVLEELILRNMGCDYWNSFSISSKTLKKLTRYEDFYDDLPNSVSFDTPNLVYLEYSDTIAFKYPQVNFDSLVEASIDLRMTDVQKGTAIYVSDSDEGTKMVGDAAKFIMGICNVKTLCLSDDTLETLTFCCEAIPEFKNLNHLTIESNPGVGWGSLPDLLKNCPNLETLVFQGLLHRATDRYGDMCLCKGLEKSPSCLSSSSVKVLKILNVGENEYYGDMEKEMEQIKNFLAKMPKLEKLIVYYNTPIEDDDLVEVSKELQMLPEAASLNCQIQVISDNLNLSFTLPISLPLKFGLLM